MFLENFYGTLFYPSETFERLKQNTNLILGLFIVIAISAINPLLKTESLGFWSTLGIIFAMFIGVVKWFSFAVFLEILAGIFKRGGKIEVFLTLSAFALLPWIFMAPVILFKSGGFLTGIIGFFAGVLVWIWSTVLSLFAVVKAYELSSERILLLIFVPLLGCIIFLDWVIGFFSTLGGIALS